MLSLFKKTKLLEHKVDQYLDLVSETALVFREGIRHYLNGEYDEFEIRLKNLRTMEHSADILRRGIELELYQQTLIPESRGDVLALLETIDKISNQGKSTLLNFSIEKPSISPEFNQDYLQLSDYVIQAVDAVIKSTRSFFGDVNAVKDNLHKVFFYEGEADKATEKITRSIFNSDLHLSHKTHLRNFAHHIDRVADFAEDVADRLAIYSLKRSI